MAALGKYIRQIMLKDFGVEKQTLLSQARVLVIGAGGISCPALQYLNSMGVGTLGIIDPDRVAESNLHRQILFGPQDIGRFKVDAARDRLLAQNPDTQIHTYPERFDTRNALQLIADYDIVLDGSDNFETRYLVNDACVLCNKPLVHGSVYAHEAQLAVFNYPQNGHTTQYRDAFPVPPQAGEIPSCNEAGILGVYPGILGNLQALEVIKIITKSKDVLCHRILTLRFTDYRMYYMDITPNSERAALTTEEFLHTNYSLPCTL